MLFRVMTAVTPALLLLSGASLMAQHNDPITSQADQCMQAIVQGDFEKLAKLTYPALVNLAGGEEHMAQSLRTTYATMKEQGYSFDSGRVEDVARTVTTRHRRFAIVPYVLHITTPQGTISQDGSLVGVSEDEGKSWTFIDLNDNADAMLPKLFPDEQNLAKTLSLSSPKKSGSKGSK